jgi:transcriptional regulator of acetoin/glycerol metabolism
VEREHIERILVETAWNISHAAEILQVDRGTLYNKIRKYDLRNAGANQGAGHTA